MRCYKGARRKAAPTNQEKSQTRASTKSMPTKKPPLLQRAAFQNLLSRAKARPTTPWLFYFN